MKEGFTIWIPDDAEIQGLNIAIVVKDSKDNGVGKGVFTTGDFNANE